MDQSANHVLLRGSQPGAADRMRDLLARTLQDHASDQRSHASALEEIRKYLEGLEWLVKEVRQHELTDLSGQLAAQTEGLLRQLAEARECLDDKLGALDARLSGTDGKVGALANRIDRLDDRIGDTDDRIGLINEHIAAVEHKLGALDGRMDGLGARLEGVGGRIEGVNAKFEAVDGRMEALGSYFAGVDGRIMALGDHLMAFGDRLNGVHQVTARLTTLDERLSDALTPLMDELRLRPGHAEVEEVVAKVVSAAQAEMTARLDSLEETVLTLAEALLRPVRHIADQRREGERS